MQTPALQFLAAARRDPELGRRLAEIDPDADLAELLEIGEQLGFSFTEIELREAYAQDWGLRRMRYEAER
jgi:hypothetical protein